MEFIRYAAITGDTLIFVFYVLITIVAWKLLRFINSQAKVACILTSGVFLLCGLTNLVSAYSTSQQFCDSAWWLTVGLKIATASVSCWAAIAGIRLVNRLTTARKSGPDPAVAQERSRKIEATRVLISETLELLHHKG